MIGTGNIVMTAVQFCNYSSIDFINSAINQYCILHRLSVTNSSAVQFKSSSNKAITEMSSESNVFFIKCHHLDSAMITINYFFPA